VLREVLVATGVSLESFESTSSDRLNLSDPFQSTRGRWQPNSKEEEHNAAVSRKVEYKPSV
jgi:hypothetical protein